MKNIFEKNGGIRLHLDGTGESGDDVVFVAKESETGITMDAQIIPTESKEHIVHFLKEQKTSFGEPIVVIRDMSKQIRDAVTEVFPDVKQQICHYHYVKNLGKILFKEKYADFRKDIINLNVLCKLKKIKKEISSSGIETEDVIIQTEKYWTLLLIENILSIREKSSDYPFTLPYLEIIERIKNIYDMIKKVTCWNKKNNMFVKEVIYLSDQLQIIMENKNISSKQAVIQKIWNWFERIRVVLRIGRNLSERECNNETSNAKIIKQKMNKIIREIKKEAISQDKELKRAADQIVHNYKKHSEELFVEVKDISGKVVNILRDNNIQERGHRWSRMHIRRRTGRSRTTNEMAKYGALLAIFSNMENEIYVRKVNNMKNFIQEFQDITQSEIDNAKKLIKPCGQKYLIKSDQKREKMITKFMEIFDKQDVKKAAEEWIEKLNSPNQSLTP